jgi:hypothetical protein
LVPLLLLPLLVLPAVAAPYAAPSSIGKLEYCNTRSTLVACASASVEKIVMKLRLTVKLWALWNV